MVFQCGKPGNHPQLPMTYQEWVARVATAIPSFWQFRSRPFSTDGGRVQGRATAVGVSQESGD